MPGHNRGSTSVRSLFALTVVLVIAWLLWSGIYTPMLLGLGALSIALTLYLAVRVNFFAHTEGLLGLLPRLPGYWMWLIKEIIVSSWDVARIVLSPSLPISPTLVTLRSRRDEELPQVILGNSITLSPGTVTLDIDEYEVLVHCISEAGADALLSGELLRRVEQLERKPT